MQTERKMENEAKKKYINFLKSSKYENKMKWEKAWNDENRMKWGFPRQMIRLRMYTTL